MSEQVIRSFIAIEISEEVKKELISFKEKFTSNSYSFLRWVSSENMHLTLKFLGNIKIDKIDLILKEIKEACYGVPSFILRIEGLGIFPNLRRPRILWVGVSGDLENLLKIQKSIDDRLDKLGYAREKRPFSPHITLARVRENITAEDISNFQNFYKGISFQSRYVINVSNINLMKSVLYPTGAVYSKIGEAKLTG